MKALLIADTHFLWYASGRWKGDHKYNRPRVDYMALRNFVSGFLIKRFGEIYELDCKAFVVNKKNGSMDRFTDLLNGFGYMVHECKDPTSAIMETLNQEYWDLVILAVGSVEIFASMDLARKEGKRIIAAMFENFPNRVDANLRLDQNVLYEGQRN